MTEPPSRDILEAAYQAVWWALDNSQVSGQAAEDWSAALCWLAVELKANGSSGAIALDGLPVV